MKLIDWKSALKGVVAPSEVAVTFSSLSVPDDRASVNPNVAHLIIKNDTKVDIEWDDDARQYFVNVYREDYTDSIGSRWVSEPFEVVQAVKELIEEHCGVLGTSATSQEIRTKLFSGQVMRFTMFEVHGAKRIAGLLSVDGGRPRVTVSADSLPVVRLVAGRKSLVAPNA